MWNWGQFYKSNCSNFLYVQCHLIKTVIFKLMIGPQFTFMKKIIKCLLCRVENALNLFKTFIKSIIIHASLPRQDCFRTQNESILLWGSEDNFLNLPCIKFKAIEFKVICLSHYFPFKHFFLLPSRKQSQSSDFLCKSSPKNDEIKIHFYWAFILHILKMQPFSEVIYLAFQSHTK